jgi:predicted nucleic acid-binding protein
VLIDERTGWRAAQNNGHTPVGSVGIILPAKKKGLITEVKPHLHVMRNKGLYLSKRVIDNAIIQAGETP